MIIKLGLVDDSHMLREYFVDFFKRCPEFEVLFSVSDLKDLYRVKCASQPDIILLDIMLPSGNSLKSISKVKQLFPYAHIVILSAVAVDRSAAERQFWLKPQCCVIRSIVPESLDAHIIAWRVRRRVSLAKPLGQPLHGAVV